MGGQSKILSPITIQQRFGHVYYGKTMHVMPKTKNPMASPNAWLWSQGLDTYAVKPYKELGWGVARDCLIQGIILGFVIFEIFHVSLSCWKYWKLNLDWIQNQIFLS